MDVRKERLNRSMTQKRLAFEAGIDARTLRKIEKGEHVSPESRLAVWRVLGIGAVAGSRGREAAVLEEGRNVVPPRGIRLSALTPVAILVPVAAMVCSFPQWALPAIVSGCLLAVLVAVASNLPATHTSRSYVGGGLLLLTGIFAWQREIRQFGDYSSHLYMVMAALVLAMLSPRFRDLLVPLRNGERSFERLLVLIQIYVAYYCVRMSSWSAFGWEDVVEFYRWHGMPLECVALLALPFRRARAAAFLSIGAVNCVRLPDFPILLLFGGNPILSAETLFEMSIRGIAWHGCIAMLAFVCAVSYVRHPLERARRYVVGQRHALRHLQVPQPA